MDRRLAEQLDRWQAAGIVDAATVERIRECEERDASLRGSRLGGLTYAFGGLLLGAGILLFVASNWPWLSPAARYVLLAATVAGLHVAAAAVTLRMPGLATTLHAVGTCALGAGVFLSGQAFNLAEHWPEGLLLWALGAAAALYWLRDWPHVIYVAVLVPAWLASLWVTHMGFTAQSTLTPLAVGLFTLGVAYLAATSSARDTHWRRVLAHVGASMTAAAGAALPFAVFREPGLAPATAADSPTVALTLAWLLAVGLPLAVGYGLRGREAWPLGIALAFALLATRLDATDDSQRLALHALYLAGAVGLTAWGVRDAHRLRINIGVIAFAAVVLSFYFSSVFDRIGRSLGLVALGVLFLGGGWLLERTRRRLLARVDRGSSA